MSKWTNKACMRRISNSFWLSFWFWSIKSKNRHLCFLFSTSALEPFCFKLLLHSMSSVNTAGELLLLCPCQLVDVAFFKDWLGCFCNEPQRFLQLLKRKFAIPFFILPFPKAAQDRLIQQCTAFTPAFNSIILWRYTGSFPFFPCTF